MSQGPAVPGPLATHMPANMTQSRIVGQPCFRCGAAIQLGDTIRFYVESGQQLIGHDRCQPPGNDCGGGGLSPDDDSSGLRVSSSGLDIHDHGWWHDEPLPFPPGPGAVGQVGQEPAAVGLGAVGGRSFSPISAYQFWSSNAELIADAAALGYIYGRVLDATYGQGTFWRKYRPESLWTNDLDPQTTAMFHDDFRDIKFTDGRYDCVVFDPPYKLNGTPDPQTDKRYGTHTPTRWQDRMQLIHDGLRECARVLGSGYLLVKCQDQVSSGKVRWQSYQVTKWAEELGLGLVDRFDMLGGRPQPGGKRQVHARRNASQLLIFKRGWDSGS